MPILSLGGEDPLEEEMATHSSILGWKIPWTEGYSPWGCKESDTTEDVVSSDLKQSAPCLAHSKC